MEANEYSIMAHVETTHWWYAGMRRIADAWLRQIPLGPHARILDAGCGTGGNLSWLSHYGDVSGFDYADIALHHAASKSSADLLRASIMHIPCADQSFDLVTSFEVIYHRAVADDVVALAECRRVLRPDGHLLVRVPAFEWLRGHHDDRVHGARRYTIAQLTAKLAQAGLEPITMSYVNTLLMPLALVQRARERQSTQAHTSSDLQLPSPIVNNIAMSMLSLEAAMLAKGVTLPVGVSLLCLARPVRP